MNIDLSLLTSNAVIAVPIVIAIVQAIKLTNLIPDHFAPIVAIAVGILIGFVGNHDTGDLSTTVLYGAVYGLMASGLYSGVKTTMMARSRQKQQRAHEKKFERNHYDKD